MSKKGLGIVILSVIISTIAVLLATSAVIKTKKENPECWVLHSYGNHVALFNGDEIVEIYGTISIDTLPEEDKRLLENGIRFTTKAEAMTAIEDYDG